MSTQELSAAATEAVGHRNDVDIYDYSGTIDKIVLNPKFQIISPDQPVDWKAITINHDKSKNKWNLNIWAGRHKTAGVANAFLEWSTSGGPVFPAGTNMFSADYDKAMIPSELNFAFGIDVTFMVNRVPLPPLTLYLGQGSNDDNMPWWIGGPNIMNSDSKKEAKLHVGATSLTLKSGGNDHAFSLTSQA